MRDKGRESKSERESVCVKLSRMNNDWKEKGEIEKLCERI